MKIRAAWVALVSIFLIGANSPVKGALIPVPSASKHRYPICTKFRPPAVGIRQNSEKIEVPQRRLGIISNANSSETRETQMESDIRWNFDGEGAKLTILNFCTENGAKGEAARYFELERVRYKIDSNETARNGGWTAASIGQFKHQILEICLREKHIPYGKSRSIFSEKLNPLYILLLFENISLKPNNICLILSGGCGSPGFGDGFFDVGILGRNSRSCSQRSVSGGPGCRIGADQEPSLEKADSDERCRKSCKPPSIISDTLVSRFWNSPAGGFVFGLLITAAILFAMTFVGRPARESKSAQQNDQS